MTKKLNITYEEWIKLPTMSQEEAMAVWGDRFVEEFAQLPQGRAGNCKEKKEFVRKLAMVRYKGKRFSEKALGHAMKYSDHGTVRKFIISFCK